MNLIEKQKLLCHKFNADFVESPPLLKIGISLNIKNKILPIHGLRHPMTKDTTGWYIWAGDYSDTSDFFQPLHAKHLEEWCPWVLPYLGLAPGWRFLVTPDYEDIWQDKKLLEI